MINSYSDCMIVNHEESDDPQVNMIYIHLVKLLKIIKFDEIVYKDKEIVVVQ